MSARTHRLAIGGLTRELPLFEVSPGVSIAVLNILGDIELVQRAATELAPRIAVRSPSAIVTPEAKSIPLAYELATVMKLPYVVLRKNRKSYMGEALSVTTVSITTGREQTLYLDEKDRGLVVQGRIALVDDVVSSGSTLRAMRDLVARAGGTVVAEAAICTEGDAEVWRDVIALGHLPLFAGEARAGV